jgi:hypothetical protein
MTAKSIDQRIMHEYHLAPSQPISRTSWIVQAKLALASGEFK